MLSGVTAYWDGFVVLAGATYSRPSYWEPGGYEISDIELRLDDEDEARETLGTDGYLGRIIPGRRPGLNACDPGDQALADMIVDAIVAGARAMDGRIPEWLEENLIDERYDEITSAIVESYNEPEDWE